MRMTLATLFGTATCHFENVRHSCEQTKFCRMTRRLVALVPLSHKA